jgi:hypothetical protein
VPSSVSIPPSSRGSPPASASRRRRRPKAGRSSERAATSSSQPPPGSGKTLAGFLSAVDSLFQQGDSLAPQTQIVCVSPLRALSNDIQKNLKGPLAEIRALDPSLPEVRVLVRTGDTPAPEKDG